MPTRGATAALANMSFGRANASQQPLQSLIAALGGGVAPQAPQAVQAPRVQNAAFGQQGGFQVLKHSVADLALRERPPAERDTDFQRTKLRRAGTMDEYRAQVAEYNRVQGNVLGTEHRGYPMTPGTAEPGTGECMDCGYPRHRNEACTKDRLLYKERDYRRMAGAIAWGLRGGQGRRGGAVAAAAVPNVNQAAVNLFMLLTQAASVMQAQRDEVVDGNVHIDEVEQGNGGGVSD